MKFYAAAAPALLLAGALLWCAGIVLAPLLNLRPVYEFFALICHQDPNRSFTIAGTPLPVCIRCTSIYFGFFLSLLFSIPSTPRAVKVAIVATLAEFVIALTVWDSPWLRATTGLALGATVAPFVTTGVQQMLRRGEFRDAV